MPETLGKSTDGQQSRLVYAEGQLMNDSSATNIIKTMSNTTTQRRVTFEQRLEQLLPKDWDGGD